MKLRILCSAAALGLATASAAQADNGWLGISALGWQQTPGWFVAPGVSGGFQQLPRWNSTVTRHAPAAVGAPQISGFSHAPELSGAEAGLTIGYAFRDGALPPWLGTRVRLGLTGSWQSFSDTVSSNSAAPAPSAIQYDSAIPGVSNPTAPLVTLTPGNTGSGARVRFDDGFRYGGFLNLRIPLIFM